MAELVGFALAHDVGRDPARILNVLVAVEDLPDGLGLVPRRMPKMHCELRRGLSSKMRSVGVLERIPPSQ